MIDFEYWAVTDTADGITIRFTTEDAAKHAAKGLGVHGSDASVVHSGLPLLFDSYEDYEEWYNLIHPIIEQENPELYKVIKFLSQSEIDILKKNGLNI